MGNSNYLSFNSDRRFGIEIELNSFDNRDFYLLPRSNKEEKPQGIEEIAVLIQNYTGCSAVIETYKSTHNNHVWVLKPDRSCGMEVCSPVSKGWPGLEQICRVAELLRSDHRVLADERCSLHVHMEVKDCCRADVAKILTYWIKCESVILDSFPIRRKSNCFCRAIGQSDLFSHNEDWDDAEIYKKLGTHKYFTANCCHHYKKKRPTLEFRTAENSACCDAFFIKNWTKFLIHFVERSLVHDIPGRYNSHNVWTGFSWFDPEDVMKFLGFTEEYSLSEGLIQTRNWFLARIYKNINTDVLGVWSPDARKIAKKQVERIISGFGLNTKNINEYLIPENSELIYGNDYKN